MERVRSFWGWGYEDKFPSDEARKAMAAKLALVFGVAPSLGHPPRLEALNVAAPRFMPPLELRNLGTTDTRVRVTHAYGRGYRDLIRGFRGEFAAPPDWVFYPTHEDHLVALYRFCESEAIALVPYGGGTSVVGGVECSAGGRFRGTACVDLSRMDRVLEVDTASLSARIQAGASGPRIAEQLAAHGLSLRHYPQSFELSTLGGWIATRAGGHFATLFTHIDDLVQSVRMVTPSGVFETRRVPASGAGPAPERLVLGSEGALGIVTEAWMRVMPRPRWRASASVQFERWTEAVDATRALAQSGLYPSNCRLLDSREAMLHDVASGASVLLLAFESPDHPIEPWMERALSIATDFGGQCSEEPRYTTDVVHSVLPRPRSSVAPPPMTPLPPKFDRDAAESAAWKESFIEAPYMQSALVSLGVICDTFETACTWGRFAELHANVRRAVEGAMKKECGAGLVTCRFTHVYPDGPAPYYTFLAPGRAGAELEQWAAIKAAATEAILASGGTITHHHAVGRVHREAWQGSSPALFEQVLASAKDKLDPQGIMNPGCLLPPRG